jgi:nitroreductase
MKSQIKKFLGENKESPFYGWSSKIYKKYSPYLTIFTNMIYDAFFFAKHSNVFSLNALNKVEAKIILDYHSIEKGLLFENTRLGFAREKIERLNKLLKKEIIRKNAHKSQILVAYKIMCEYYELHKQNAFNIENYFSKSDYELYCSILSNSYSSNFKGIIEYDKKSFYQNVKNGFDQFSYSRKSIRNFKEELVEDELVEKAITLSLNAPSVCNRQPSRVYYVKDKKKIDQILEIQAGLSGFSQDIRQLLVVTADVSYFYLVGERYQHYIDGGLFLMNLLYALHFYEIGTCPANWAKEMGDEKAIKEIIPIEESEKVICVVAIGKPKDNFRVTLSQRRDLNEVLTKIE